MIENENLLEHAQQLGEVFRSGCEALQAGVRPDPRSARAGRDDRRRADVEGAPIVKACLERKLLINCTHGTVIRLLPAMNLTEEQVHEGCDILAEVLKTAIASN